LWTRAVALVLTAAAVLVGCGGGIGEGGTGSFASGPITGFGSVIVNEITFDDSDASVEDGEGAVRARSELRLGMTVEVEGGAVSQGSARAGHIRFDSALLGPVEAVNVANGAFTVLGQTVAVDATTVFDEALAGGLVALAALQADQAVEVYAVFDPSGPRFRATRVELRRAALAYRVRGIVAEVFPQLRTLRIGSALFVFDNLGSAPVPQVGQFVRLTLAKTPLPGALGRWPVLAFGTPLREIGDRDNVSFKGLITAFRSIGDFQVDGRAVDASAAQIAGGSAALAPGVRVEVGGALRAGV
jgi:hypothetical protein